MVFIELSTWCNVGTLYTLSKYIAINNSFHIHPANYLLVLRCVEHQKTQKSDQGDVIK